MGLACQKLCSNEKYSGFNNTTTQDSSTYNVDMSTLIQCSSPIISFPSDKQISLRDFEKINNLGNGGFGDVILVKKKSNKKIYAMKIIKKDKIISRNFIGKMNCEKKILLENNSPFLVSLKYSFQTAHKLYLVMEYCPGGDLFKHLKKQTRFSLETARFVAAEVLLGLEYLHNEMKVIYRDLKPENILLTANGHIKIADFGLGKQLQDQNELTHTFIGTQEYISPEMILTQLQQNCKGYSQKSDIWAFGIFLYELIHGKPPYTHPARSWNQIMKQILDNNLQFSKYFDASSQSLIEQCLNNDPEQRPRWDEIKQHDFFENIDWDLVKQRGYESQLKEFIHEKNHGSNDDAESIAESCYYGQHKKFDGFTYDPQDRSFDIDQKLSKRSSENFSDKHQFNRIVKSRNYF